MPFYIVSVSMNANVETVHSKGGSRTLASSREQKGTEGCWSFRFGMLKS